MLNCCLLAGVALTALDGRPLVGEAGFPLAATAWPEDVPEPGCLLDGVVGCPLALEAGRSLLAGIAAVVTTPVGGGRPDCPLDGICFSLVGEAGSPLAGFPLAGIEVISTWLGRLSRPAGVLATGGGWVGPGPGVTLLGWEVRGSERLSSRVSWMPGSLESSRRISTLVWRSERRGRGNIVGKLCFAWADTVETICREARSLNSLAASRDRGFSVDLS